MSGASPTPTSSEMTSIFAAACLASGWVAMSDFQHSKDAVEKREHKANRLADLLRATGVDAMAVFNADKTQRRTWEKTIALPRASSEETWGRVQALLVESPAVLEQHRQPGCRCMPNAHAVLMEIQGSTFPGGVITSGWPCPHGRRDESVRYPGMPDNPTPPTADEIAHIDATRRTPPPEQQETEDMSWLTNL